MSQGFANTFSPLGLPVSVLNGGTGNSTGDLASLNGYPVSALADVAWTSFAGTIGAVGFTGAVTVDTAKYKKIGKTVFIQIDIGGTSNSVLFDITGLPFTVATQAFTPFSSCKNNGINNICRAIIAPAGTTMQMILGTGTAIDWATSNAKGFSGQFFYETS